MNAILTLSLTDFRSTFRDPMFRGLLFFPLLAFALVRWGWPVVIGMYPAAGPYGPVVLMWACLQSATMFGFVYGFLFLEEKEDHIWQAIRVLPVSGAQLVMSRLLLGLVISAVVNFLLLHHGGIEELPVGREVLLAVLFSLGAPFIALWLGALAQNRIEGLAQMKIINLLLVLPGLVYFLPHPAVHATALIPTYWAFRSLEVVYEPGRFALFYAGGLGYFLLCLWLLNRKMDRGLNR